jgi:uncharacterized protein YdeI (YjbR/CyaY-like superfamily)
MDIGETLHLQSREEWRTWLADHHQDRSEIWLILYKSTSDKRTFTMRDAQEEGLCFGWVDSNLKPIDSFSYALRFSPRRPQSQWGASNKARALKLLREGKMAPAGMAVLPPDVIHAWEEECSSGARADIKTKNG